MSVKFKHRKSIMAFTAIMLAASLFSCSDSDDKEGEPADPTTHDYELVGSWVHNRSFSDYSYEINLKFKKDGTYEEKTVYVEDGQKYPESHKGEWSTSGNTLTLYVTECSSKDPDDNCTGDTDRMRYYVDGDQATIDGDTYYRK